MGSRALLVVCRDDGVARARFGVTSGEVGAVYTRTGRAFFPDALQRDAVLRRARAAVEAAGLFADLRTDWVLLDAEILPWTVKAGALITGQYAPTGAAARIGLGAADAALARALASGAPVEALAGRVGERLTRARAFAAVVREFARPVAGVDDIRIAPFHLLASEGVTHADKPHRWHMDGLGRLAGLDPLFGTTAMLTLDPSSPADVELATAWWLELTERGGEGMVVKPATFLARGRRGMAQPGIKCRGREYLRLIYGPDYDLPEHLDRLRQRGLGAKRSLAIRELALGLESLERFVAREPLRRVHECVFGVLALESEPIDPRL